MLHKKIALSFKGIPKLFKRSSSKGPTNDERESILQLDLSINDPCLQHEFKSDVSVVEHINVTSGVQQVVTDIVPVAQDICFPLSSGDIEMPKVQALCIKNNQSSSAETMEDSNINAAFNLPDSLVESDPRIGAGVNTECVDPEYWYDDMPGNFFLMEEACLHCSDQMIDMFARQAKLKLESKKNNSATDGNTITKDLARPFAAFVQFSCEYEYQFCLFMPELDPKGRMRRIPIELATSPPEMPFGSRLRLCLNSHLRGEEGVRGWVIYIEAKSEEILNTAIDAIQKFCLSANIMDAIGI